MMRVMRIRLCVLLCAWMFGFASDAWSITRYVSTSGSDTSPYLDWTSAARAIQSAVNVASNGDTIIVGDGTYSGFAGVTSGPNVVILTKSITLITSNDAVTTWIDGGGSNRCVYIANTGAVVEGFTLCNGYVTASNPVPDGFVGLAVCGGGAFVKNAGVIRRCTVRNNVAHGIQYAPWSPIDGPDAYGGGVYVETATNGRVLIESCVIMSNTVITSSRTNGYYSGFPLGGGLYLRGANRTNVVAEIRNSALIGNRCTQSNVSNSAEGGGAYLLDKATALDCTVIDNVAVDGNAGGLFLWVSQARNCLIRNNHSDLSGGGVTLFSSSTLINCIVAENDGGGCDSTFSNSIISCVIISNRNIGVTGVGVAQGLSLADMDHVVNTIVRYNYRGAGEDNWRHETNEFFPPPTIDYSCMLPLPTNGVGNIDTDPLFADEDYRPAEGSACVDAGPSNTVVVGTTDFAGALRILNGRADIGAFEAWEWRPLGIASAGGTNQVQWAAVSGAVCALERSIDLCGGIWTNVGSIVTAAPTPIVLVDTGMNANAAYRLHLVTP